MKMIDMKGAWRSQSFRARRRLLEILKKGIPARLYYAASYVDSGKFVSLIDEVAMTHEWIKKLPKDFDVVVGIPRAGMLEATIISMELAKPLTTPELLIKDKIWTSPSIAAPGQIRKILLIDDSVGSGKSIQEAAELIRRNRPGVEIVKGALHVRPAAAHMVDTYYGFTEKVFTCFERDLADFVTAPTGVDFDGVLCEDCPLTDDTGEAYRAWVAAAAPYKIPSWRIPLILTGRLEKFRAESERWLDEHKVKYGKLVMRPAGERTEDFKVRVIKEERPYWYWESDPKLAEYLHVQTGVKVVCFGNMRVYY